MREWWRQLQRLQDAHVARHEVSGREALLALRQLRWDGDRLRGELLPSDEPRRP